MESGSAPPQPRAILRGHGSQVHAAVFVRSPDSGAGSGLRLFTGDADGFVVAWDPAVLRPKAVWRAHDKAILGIRGWGDGRVITHGRDNRLLVWKFSPADETALSTVLPLETTTEPRQKPWLLYALEVNTMNFCEFAMCAVPPAEDPMAPQLDEDEGGKSSAKSESSASPNSELLIAVPNTLASEAVDIFHLPSQRRMHTVSPASAGGETDTSIGRTMGVKHGMVMALALLRSAGGALTLCIGYESGVAAVMQQQQQQQQSGAEEGAWHTAYLARPHSQPILSLDVDPWGGEYFLTSGADALVVKHPIPRQPVRDGPAPAQRLRQAGQATGPSSTKGKSLLSAGLQSASSNPSRQPPPAAAAPPQLQTTPLQVLNTKHAGQQSLRIRRQDLLGTDPSAAAIFATAGWDGRVRVYSAAGGGVRELAVLAWHRTGCYSVAFAEVGGGGAGGVGGAGGGGGREAEGEGGGSGGRGGGETSLLPPRRRGLVDVTVRDRRVRTARTTHWLAAGGKDGKVSLWDVY